VEEEEELGKPKPMEDRRVLSFVQG